MSVADHFEQIPDSGFVRDYNSAAARRQFNVSLALIVVIAVAVAALSFIVRFDGPSGSSSALSPSAPPAYAGRL